MLKVLFDNDDDDDSAIGSRIIGGGDFGIPIDDVGECSAFESSDLDTDFPYIDPDITNPHSVSMKCLLIFVASSSSTSIKYPLINFFILCLSQESKSGSRSIMDDFVNRILFAAPDPNKVDGENIDSLCAIDLVNDDDEEDPANAKWSVGRGGGRGLDDN